MPSAKQHNLRSQNNSEHWEPSKFLQCSFLKQESSVPWGFAITGGTASQCHCQAHKHFSQLHLEAALVLVLNSLCIPVLKNGKNEEENIQEMEDWAVKPWSCKRKQASRCLHLFLNLCGCGISPGILWFQEMGLYCCWTISDIKSATTFIFILISSSFFLIEESPDCFSSPFKTLEMNQQDSNHSDCLHSAQEASETRSCSFTVFFL